MNSGEPQCLRRAGHNSDTAGFGVAMPAVLALAVTSALNSISHALRQFVNGPS